MVSLTGFVFEYFNLRSGRSKIRMLVGMHLKELAVKRAGGIILYSDGSMDVTRWNHEVQRFLDDVVVPKLTVDERMAIGRAGLDTIAGELIENAVRLECGRMHRSGEYDMTVPVVHRSMCASNVAPLIPAVRRVGNSMMNQVKKGLIIRDEPLENILRGVKIWEMRKFHTKVRGRIALVKKGTKSIYGIADIVDSLGPLSTCDLSRSTHLHGISIDRLNNGDVAGYRYAWVLSNIHRVSRPIPYNHAGGVVFVTLDQAAMDRVDIEIRRLGL